MCLHEHQNLLHSIAVQPSIHLPPLIRGQVEKMHRPGWTQIMLTLWKGCCGISVAPPPVFLLNYSMMLRYLPVAFWFCHWTSCQQRLISEGQRFLPHFSVNQICCYPILNGSAYVKYVTLEKSHHSGIVYIVFFIDHVAHWWDHKIRDLLSLCREEQIHWQISGSVLDSHLLQYYLPGMHWVALLWTLQTAKYTTIQHFLNLLSLACGSLAAFGLLWADSSQDTASLCVLRNQTTAGFQFPCVHFTQRI